MTLHVVSTAGCRQRLSRRRNVGPNRVGRSCEDLGPRLRVLICFYQCTGIRSANEDSGWAVPPFHSFHARKAPEVGSVRFRGAHAVTSATPQSRPLSLWGFT
jgi:hypothetical protein